MAQNYNSNTKRPKPKKNQLTILKIYAFYQKTQQRASDPVESAAGITYLSMRIHQKTCHIFPKKVPTILLSGSRKGEVEA